jgi:hypothetical protein
MEYPELAGASVVSGSVEVYVTAAAAGYQVDAWRHTGFDPYHTEQFADLSVAVVIAVEAVLDRGQRRVWRTRHPPCGAMTAIHEPAPAGPAPGAEA